MSLSNMTPCDRGIHAQGARPTVLPYTHCVGQGDLMSCGHLGMTCMRNFSLSSSFHSGLVADLKHVPVLNKPTQSL